MFNKNILFLDPGGSELKGILINEHNCKIIIKESVENSGIFNGYINNAEIFANSFQLLLNKIKEKTKKPVHKIYLIIGGICIEHKFLNFTYKNLNKTISHDILNLITEKIIENEKKQNNIVIKINDIEYNVDNVILENPAGLFAQNVTFKKIISYSNFNLINNLFKMIEKHNIEIEEVYPSIFCSAELMLTEDERILGAMVLDIGAHKIEWGYYFKNKLINCGSIPFSMDHITYKIAKILKTDIKQAFHIKHENIYATLEADNFCNWINYTSNNINEHIIESELIKLINPELENLVKQINIVSSQFSKHLNLIALSGQGALLKRIQKLLQKNLNINIKISQSADPKFDALNGAILFYINHDRQKKDNLFKRIINIVKNHL